MTNSKKIIIVATLIHLAAIVYGIIRGLWDAVILAIVLLVASLIYYSNKDKSPDPLKHSQQKNRYSITAKRFYHYELLYLLFKVSA